MKARRGSKGPAFNNLFIISFEGITVPKHEGKTGDSKGPAFNNLFIISFKGKALLYQTKVAIATGSYPLDTIQKVTEPKF